MYYNFKDYVYSILPKVPLDSIHTVIPLIKEDKINKLKHILLIYALIPKTSEEFLLKEGSRDLIQQGRIERRMVNKSYIGIILTENQVGVMFPNKEGKTDMNFMFCNDISKDNGLFHE